MKTLTQGSFDAIAEARSSLGMSDGHRPPEKLRRAIVQAFYDKGLSYAQIVCLLGIGEATVSRLLRLYREAGNVMLGPSRSRSSLRGVPVHL
ncbi:helix-turn-helix domain-containing protein [Corallococcus sp. NCSPR001]|uniref:helix-turn-helix domain-containing protein n=1 Tax=Corallococcus sp. NCRR TaxID=2996782 RepID=UPI001A8DFB46|nr:helix-turn-helix domain-containing protein [Corallococcus sp. NCSPR001]